MIEQKKISRADSLKQKLKTINFKNKLLIVFLLSSFATLAATNIEMFTLILNFRQQDLNFITQENKKFYQQSTLQVVQSLAKNGVASRELSTVLIHDLTLAYSYFFDKQDTYTSLQTKNPSFPKLTSSFTQPSNITGIYLFSQNSTYYQDPYFDTIINLSDRSHYRSLRRINVIYYNTDNTSDIMVRTFPATNDFIIRKPEDVAIRFNDLQILYVDRTATYTQAFSKKDTTSKLLAFRSLLISKANPKVKILIQIELQSKGLTKILHSVCFFPSTNSLSIQLNKTSGQWFVSSSAKKVDFDITPMIQPGTRTITLQNGTQVISGTVGFPTHAPINSFSSFTYSDQTIHRFVVVTQTNQTKTSDQFMENFIRNQETAIFTILISWSFFMLFLCVCVALVVGDNIFRHLNFASEKIKQYIQSPKQKGNVIQQLNSIPVKGVFKQLIKRIVQIIRKIQNSKKQIQSHKRNRLLHPLNICEKDFQVRNAIRDYQVLEKVEVQLAKKHKKESSQ